MKFTPDMLDYSEMRLKHVKFLFILLKLLTDELWFGLGKDLLRLQFYIFEILYEFSGSFDIVLTDIYNRIDLSINVVVGYLN